jgi:hypothetical protein
MSNLNRAKYTFLSDIEIQSHDGYAILTTKTEPSAVTFEVSDGSVMVNMTEFKNFCDRDDVSLSSSERDDLLNSIEIEIGDTLHSHVEEIGDGFFESKNGTVIYSPES